MAFVGEGLHTAPAAALTAFSLPDGKPVWERQFRSHVESAATLDPENNRLWTPSGEESVWALRMDDGAVLWRQKIGHTDASPLYLDGKLYVSAQPFEKDKAAPETRLFELDPDTGAVKWQVKLDGNSMGSPQAGPKGVILLTSAIGQVGPSVETDQGWSHAVGTDGKILWTVKLPGLPLPEAAVLAEAGIVIHTLKTGVLIALNALDGSILWEVKIGREFLAPAALRTGGNPPLLASIAKEGIVSIINALDGIEIRRFNMKQGGYVPPVFDGDVMYVTTPRGISAYGGVHLLTRGSN
jgi:outer membrane protein assembly factor BamB